MSVGTDVARILPSDLAATTSAPTDVKSRVDVHEASTADHARLSKELAELNAELESRVVARTIELEAANEQLRRSTWELADTLAELAETNRNLKRERAERGRVEGELRIAHRLEAVGQLAAGIAHEINTPIQYVGDSLHFLRSAFDDLTPLLDRLARMPAVLEALGGESEEGRGTRVIIELPLIGAPPLSQRSSSGASSATRVSAGR